MAGTSLAGGDTQTTWLPETCPSTSVRFPKRQLTPALRSGASLTRRLSCSRDTAERNRAVSRQSCPNLPQIPSPSCLPFQNDPLKSPTCPQVLASCPFMGKGGGERKPRMFFMDANPPRWAFGHCRSGVVAMADFCPLVALQKLCHPPCLCQDPESSSDRPQTPELNLLPAHCMDRTHHPALAGQEQVPSDPTTAGECPHGKPVPGRLSPLSPHHFYSGFWGQPRKGRQQDQLPQGAGGLRRQQLGSFGEPGPSAAHRGAFWETKPFLSPATETRPREM